MCEQIIEYSEYYLKNLHNPPLGENVDFIENSQETIRSMEENGPLELVNKMLQNILAPGYF